MNMESPVWYRTAIPEEQELYRVIVEAHPNLSEDQIVESVGLRLKKEGLS